MTFTCSMKKGLILSPFCHITHPLALRQGFFVIIHKELAQISNWNGLNYLLSLILSCTSGQTLRPCDDHKIRVSETKRPPQLKPRTSWWRWDKYHQSFWLIYRPKYHDQISHFLLVTWLSKESQEKRAHSEESEKKKMRTGPTHSRRHLTCDCSALRLLSSSIFLPLKCEGSETKGTTFVFAPHLLSRASLDKTCNKTQKKCNWAL